MNQISLSDQSLETNTSQGVLSPTQTPEQTGRYPEDSSQPILFHDKKHLSTDHSSSEESTTVTDRSSSDPSPIQKEDFFLPHLNRPKFQPNIDPEPQFRTIQKWEGVVKEIKEDYFVARLYDLMEDGPYEETEILIEDVSAPDRELIRNGSFFYLMLGREKGRKGQIQKVSKIRFKRVPPLTSEDIDEALDQSNDYQTSIHWE